VLPGVVRTRVGYCGGSLADPTYRKVCNNADFADYAETISLEFDPSILSYEEMLDAFFRAHDSQARGRSRQYASIIFAHTDTQRAAAEERLCSADNTLIEAAPEVFWDAEPYHQKWLLQRKRELFLSLGMTDPAELIERPATVLNAIAARRFSDDVAMERVAALELPAEREAAVMEALYATTW